jgi:hypothetical protein
MSRRFPPAWHEEKIAGGDIVRDANGQVLVHIFARSRESEAIQAKMLTMDEARRIAGDLLVYCDSERCHHSATLNADRLPDETGYQ